MALFRLVSVALPEGGAAKLSKFEYFTLTLMKLRLNVSNYDLAFRFGISESSVCHVFSKWIEAMDIQLSFLILWPDRMSIKKRSRKRPKNLQRYSTIFLNSLAR